MINKIVTKLPQVKLRGLGQATQRSITNPKQWREAKINVQAVAGRSFQVLKRNLEIKVKKLIQDFQHYSNDLVFLDQIDKEIKKAYKKAYMLGLKASGLTLYEKNNTFKKTSLPTLDPKEAQWLDKTIFDKQEQIDNIVLSGGKNLIDLITTELFRFYQHGRLVGAPIYSFVYFNCDSKNPECKHLVDNSPWPREKVEEFNPCCRFKIIPKTAEEYRDRLIDF